MAAITNRLRPNNISRDVVAGGVFSVALALGVFGLAQRSGYWLLAGIAMSLVEGWWYMRMTNKGVQSWAALAQALAPMIIMGWSTAIIITLVPRLATQVAVAVVYAGWRFWWTQSKQPFQMVNLLVVQATMFEALFLMAAVWRPADWVVLLAVWFGSYVTTYGVMRARNERTAAMMAAAWALVVAEVSWVLLLWLFTYVTPGWYVLVPQPALVLVALAYCFGNIYTSAKQGSLSRARLMEYLLIGLIVIGMVVTGTSWKSAI